MVIKNKWVSLFCVFFAFQITITPLFSAEDFTSLLTKGIQAYDQNDFTAAEKFLRQAQQLNPSSQQVAEELDRIIEKGMEWETKTVREKLVQMIVRGEDNEKISPILPLVRQILAETSEQVRRHIQDQAEIAKAVEAIADATDRGDAFVSMVGAANRFGRYLVPELVVYLDKQEPDDRVLAQRMLLRLGRDAVIPLIFALDSSSDLVREQIVRMLGQINNPLAVSTLKYVLETDKSDVVKAAAKHALESRFPDAPQVTAWQHLLVDAKRFIRNQNTLPRPNYSPYMWRFENGRLVGEKVLPFQVERSIADLLLRRSAKAAKNMTAAWAPYVANRAAQVRLYHDTLELMKKAGAEEAAIALLEGQAQRFERMAHSVNRMPIQIIAQALQNQLQELEKFGGSPAAGLQLIKVIRETSSHNHVLQEVKAALLSALNAENLLIRFESALTIARLRCALSQEEGNRVVEVLGSAVQYPGVRVAVVVSPQEDVRVHMGSIIDKSGYLAITYENVLKALGEAAAFPPKHIVFLDADIKERSIPESINYLRHSQGGADIPIVVFSMNDADRLAALRDTYNNPEKKVQVISARIDQKELKKSVLDPVSQTLQDNRKEGEGRAELAAESILGLLNGQASYDISQITDALRRTAEDTNRPDAVRIPAVKALGFVGGDKELKSLAAKIKQADTNSVEVRVAALWAVGEILQRLELSLTGDDDLHTLLSECLVAEQETIREEASRTIGKAKWEPELYLTIEKTTGPFNK